MAEIWQTVIGVKPIGIFDDFFELGGHSLLALQLLTRVRDVFHTELPMQVFESPTVAGLAEQLIVNETQAGRHSRSRPRSSRWTTSATRRMSRGC